MRVSDSGLLKQSIGHFFCRILFVFLLCLMIAFLVMAMVLDHESAVVVVAGAADDGYDAT